MANRYRCRYCKITVEQASVPAVDENGPCRWTSDGMHGWEGA